MTLANGFAAQRITVTGTATSDAFVTLDCSFITGALAALAVGEKIQLQVAYTVAGNMTGFRQVTARWSPTDSYYGGSAKNFRESYELTGTDLNSATHTVREVRMKRPV